MTWLTADPIEVLADVLRETGPDDWPGTRTDRVYDAPHRAWAARLLRALKDRGYEVVPDGMKEPQ